VLCQRRCLHTGFGKAAFFKITWLQHSAEDCRLADTGQVAEDFREGLGVSSLVDARCAEDFLPLFYRCGRGGRAIAGCQGQGILLPPTIKNCDAFESRVAPVARRDRLLDQLAQFAGSGVRPVRPAS
jgi:hypothetical protein